MHSRGRRPRSLFAMLASAVLLIAAVVTPAGAITNGHLDGEDHSFVGIMIAKNADGVPLWRCSGTLLSSTVFLTAGHCNEAPATDVEIWFASGPIPLGTGYPAATPGDPCDGITGYPCTGDVSGSPLTHPDYDPNAFFLRDVGVVLLDAEVERDRYGLLPDLNQLDVLATKRGRQNVTFRSVGYGLQYINPVHIQADRIRMVAYPKLIQINVPGFSGDFSLLLSNNAKTGGTCFGDSGGPNFLGDTDIVAAVTSYGINNCTGVGGVFRMDRSWSLDWVSGFLN